MKFSLKKSLKKTLATAIASFIAFSAIPCVNIFAANSNNLQAFPGAEGGGKFATGGRNGTVYHVTNLKDSGAGSFRDAVSKPDRIVVFDVGGTIELKSNILVSSNITIAGQTAPGGKGITLKNYKLGMSGDNIIVRYISSRPGTGGSNNDYDAWGGAKGSNSIIDHCSLGWAIDEQWGLYSNNQNYTVQYSIIGPANSFGGHSKGIHGFGIMFGKGNASWHHNLIAHNISRNFRGKVEGTSVMDYVNNVVYDWGYQTVYGTLGHLNYANNYYKAGNSTTGGYNYINFSSGSNYEKYKFYLTGNKMENANGSMRDDGTKNWSLINFGSTYNEANGYGEKYYRTDNHMPIIVNGVDTSVTQNMDTADQAFANVTKYAGAGINSECKPKIDLEVCKDAINGTGNITGTNVNNPGSYANDIEKYHMKQVDYTNYYPAPVLEKEIVDSDNDGMPDEWEIARGLDPDDASDATGDYLGEGYNNIEYYINDLTVNSFPPGTFTPSKEIVNSDYVTTTWKASENKKAFDELMDGLFAKDALTYTGLETTIDKVKFNGYVTGIKSSAPLIFEPVYNGDYTIYYRLGSNKTFKITDEYGTIVGIKSNSDSNALETCTKVAVEAGKTYYAYVEGSNAYFYGARFERLKTASPLNNNYSEYKFDLTSDKGTDTYISDNSQRAEIKILSGFKYHNMGGYNASVGNIIALNLNGSGRYTNISVDFDLLYPSKASATAEVFDANDTTYSKSLAKVNLTADNTNPVKLVFDGDGGHSYIIRVTSDSASYFLAKGLNIKTKTGLVKKIDTSTDTTTETTTEATTEVTTENIQSYEFNLTSDKGTNANISDDSGKAYVKLLPSFKYHTMGGYNAVTGDILSLAFDGKETYKNTEIKFDFLYPNKAKGTATIYDTNDMTKALASVTASADGTNPISLKFDAVGGHSYIVKITSDSASYFLARKVIVETKGNLIEDIEKEEIIEYNFTLTSDLGTNKVISDSTQKANIKLMPSFRYHTMGGYNALVGDILFLTFDGDKTHKDTAIEFDFLYPNKAKGTATVYDTNDITKALASVTASADGTNPVSLKFDAVGGHSYIVKITSDFASYFLAKGVNIKTGGKLITVDSYNDREEQNTEIIETEIPTEVTTEETTTEETTTEETTTEETTQASDINNGNISIDITDDIIYVHAGETISFNTIVNSNDKQYYFELNGGNWWFEPVDNFVNVWGGQPKILTNAANTFTINQWCGLEDGYEFTLTAYSNADNSVKDTVTIVFCK